MPKNKVLNFLSAYNLRNGFSTNIWGSSAESAVKMALGTAKFDACQFEEKDIVYTFSEKVWNIYSTEILGKNKELNFTPASPQISYLQTNVYLLRNALIHNWHGYHVVYQDGLFNSSASSVYAPLHFLSDIGPGPIKTTNNISIGFLGFDDSDASNYCHFILDYISKIALYKMINRKITLVMPPLLGQSFQREVIEKLNSDGVDILIVEEGSSILVDQLFVVGANSHVSHPSFKGAQFSIDYIRRILLEKRFNTPRSKKILWLNRSNSRIIRDQNALLKKYSSMIDFYDFDLNPLSVTQQAKLFSSYDRVIGPHGAGFTNTIFMNDSGNGKVVELFAEQNGIPTFSIICSRLNIEHYSVVLQSIATAHINYPDMLINEVDVEAALSKLMEAI